MSPTDTPILIVGAGLAGLHLAWSLHLKGRPFTILSHDSGKPAWQASAGIINPVTGKRVVKSWQIDTLLPFARERYATIAHITQEPSAYHSTPLVRYFRGDADERQRYQERRKQADYAPYLKQEPQADIDGFEIAESGWVDVQAFVESSRKYFKSTNCLEETPTPFDARSIEFGDNTISWSVRDWSHVVFCEGYHGVNNPFFDWLDYRISRGDVLDFKVPGPLPQHILNREKWVLPLTESSGRTGSTYAWDDLESAPSPTDADPLLKAWPDLLPELEDAEIKQHRVGIRPGTNDSKPYAGPHPLERRIAILNGFGSKGASQSPWCAEELSKFICEGHSLPEEINPSRRLKFLKQPLEAPRDIL
ncbi:MAG: NAD(P)/FAD-dependent oxidoreductase [Opitutales bacterium]